MRTHFSLVKILLDNLLAFPFSFYSSISNPKLLLNKISNPKLLLNNHFLLDQQLP